jgi:Rrf2 family iron-sulfur cluster assembly transcriptional regulator
MSMLLRHERVMMAITVMLDVAFHGGRTSPVSAAWIAVRLGATRRGMEPLLQALARAGLLDSLRGPRGGYRLARPARRISLAEIAAAAAPGEPAEPPSEGLLARAVIEPLREELDARLREHLATLSLEALLERAATAGLHPPRNETISFVI